MTVAELLKSKGIADDVISGLPKEVTVSLDGFVSDAESKLATATDAQTKAEEARRLAEEERKEVTTYVERYGENLNKLTANEARMKAAAAYLKTLKDQGFDVPTELLSEPTTTTTTTTTARAAVPGSPA